MYHEYDGYSDYVIEEPEKPDRPKRGRVSCVFQLHHGRLLPWHTTGFQ